MKKKTLTVLSSALFVCFNLVAEAQTTNDQNKQDNQNKGNQSTTTGGTTIESETRDTKGKASVNEAEINFLKKASNAGMYEIKAANLAIEKASGPDVKDYAKMMLDHHGKGSKELSSIMMSKGVEEIKELTGEEKTMLENLKNKSGKDFDTAYKEQMVKSHKKAIKLYEDASKTVKDQEVKTHASEKLPLLKKHLESAQKLQSEKKS